MKKSFIAFVSVVIALVVIGFYLSNRSPAVPVKAEDPKPLEHEERNSKIPLWHGTKDIHEEITVYPDHILRTTTIVETAPYPPKQDPSEDQQPQQQDPQEFDPNSTVRQ